MSKKALVTVSIIILNIVFIVFAGMRQNINMPSKCGQIASSYHGDFSKILLMTVFFGYCDYFFFLNLSILKTPKPSLTEYNKP
jgi:hypothetical protein